MILHVTPMGAPRMTRADSWRKRPVVERYHGFKDALRVEVNRHGGILAHPVSLIITFHIPMPDSWSRRRKALSAGTLHQQKPDIDNLEKAVTDTLWPEGDAMIAQVSKLKRWAHEPSIELVALMYTTPMPHIYTANGHCCPISTS